ncbi:MAG: sugar-binding domain-containing protein, partial [Thermocrispum sp.]
PGVAPSVEIKQLLLGRDLHARQALARLDSVDLALVGIGANTVDPALAPGDNFFTEEHFAAMRAHGAAGEVCLHFIDADGKPLEAEVEEPVIGVTLQQLRSARRRWAVAGGARKHEAIRAALRGGWIDTLVTDAGTAEHLVSDQDDSNRSRSEARKPAPVAPSTAR